jgi:hypothetical protein
MTRSRRFSGLSVVELVGELTREAGSVPKGAPSSGEKHHADVEDRLGGLGEPPSSRDLEPQLTPRAVERFHGTRADLEAEPAKERVVDVVDAVFDESEQELVSLPVVQRVVPSEEANIISLEETYECGSASHVLVGPRW